MIYNYTDGGFKMVDIESFNKAKRWYVLKKLLYLLEIFRTIRGRFQKFISFGWTESTHNLPFSHVYWIPGDFRTINQYQAIFEGISSEKILSSKQESNS